jgi:fatty acid desaturase
VSTTSFTAEEQQAIIEKGFLLRMVCLPAGSIGLYFLASPWPVDTWSSRALWTIFTAYALFCWTSCFHETAHQTLTRWRWLDSMLGRILGTAMYVPYTVYRESHVRHHAYVNRPNDWELWPYSDPHCSLAFRRVFVFFDIWFGFILAPFIYGRIFFHADSPLKNSAVRRTIRLEYSAITLFWGLVAAMVTIFGAWQDFIVVWLIPHALAGVMQTMRKLTEHLGMASYDPLLGTRTVIGKNWMTRLGSFMNFDIFIHGPHHRHPRLAQNLLRERMEKYLAENRDANYPVYSSYLQATWAMLPYLSNPGVGMNAGAELPTPGRAGDEVNFAADAAAQSLGQLPQVTS